MVLTLSHIQVYTLSEPLQQTTFEIIVFDPQSRHYGHGGVHLGKAQFLA